MYDVPERPHETISVARTDASSSMIATSETFDKAIELSLTRRLDVHGVTVALTSASITDLR